MAARLRKQRDFRPSTAPTEEESRINDEKFTIGYIEYKEPKDPRDLHETKEVDRENARIYEINKKYESVIRELLRRLRVNQNFTIQKPASYYESAMTQWMRKIREPEYKIGLAADWLSRRDPPLYMNRDYKFGEGADLADKLAYEEFVTKQHGKMIDISSIAPPDHKRKCTCKNMWDGTSKTCAGGKLRLCWRVTDDHHFLKPDVKPHVY